VEWLNLIGYIAVGVAAVMLPGLLVGAAARLRGWLLVEVAPLISITLIATAPILAAKIGWWWGWQPMLAWTVIMALVVWLIVGVVSKIWPSAAPKAWRQRVNSKHRSGPDIHAAGLSVTGAQQSTERPSDSADQALDAAPSRRRAWYWQLIAWTLAAIIASWQFVKMLGVPTAFSVSFDNVWHLNAVRWILDMHDGSSLTLGAMGSSDQIPSFYPAAWHDLASLINLLTGSSSVVLTTNAATWVVMGVIWPLGILALSRRIFNNHHIATILAAGILASSFAAFPGLILNFGILYPNVLGFALIPGVLALLVASLKITRISSDDAPIWELLCLAALGLPGMILAHPNALLALIGIITPLVLVWSWRGWRRDRPSDQRHSRQPTHRWAYPLVGIIWTAIAIIAWLLMRTTPSWPTSNVSETTLGEFLLASPLWLRPFWVLGVLICVGLVLATQKTQWRWWLWPVAVIALLWWAGATMTKGPARSLLISGFYCDPNRLAALMPLALIPLCLMSVDWVASWWSIRTATWQSVPRRVSTTAAMVVALAIIALGTNLSDAMGLHLAQVRVRFTVLQESDLLDSDEFTLIEQLPNLLPAGSRVAVNPGAGGPLAFALEDVPVTAYHIFYVNTPALETINDSLDEVASEPDLVCPALASLNVDYVLDFGVDAINEDTSSLKGFDQLSTAPGFTEIARVGDAALYRIDACNA
jgi:hypothetical protein